jgi:hypothetical protein
MTDNPMVARVAAAQAALDAFQGKTLSWGKTDCARLAAMPLRALGYKPGLSRFGSYKTEFGARRALLRNDMTDTPDWLDTIHGLLRIPPAAALPADIVGMPGEGGWTSLTVCMGNGRLLGFHPEAGDGVCVVVQPLIAPVAAWSVRPLSS